MANIKISALPAFTDASGLDKIPVVDVSVGDTKAYTIEQIFSGSYTVAGLKTYTDNAVWSGTGYVALPSGTTAERPSTPLNGMLRYNNETNSFEGYANDSWGSVGGGARGGGGNGILYENDINVTDSYTITIGKNAISAGPLVVEDGVAVSVPEGSRWVIV